MAARTVIVNVRSWNVDQQPTYPVDRDVGAGEGVETDCTWRRTKSSRA
jgi:hypothetical protein